MAEKEKNDDISKLQKALHAERTNHRATAATLRTAQARVTELEQAGTLSDGPTSSKVAEVIAASVAAKVASETAQLQQKVGALEAALTEAAAARTEATAKLNRRTMDDVVRQAATEAHVRQDAMADVLTIASLSLTLNEAGEAVTADGQSAADWIDSRRTESPHWWPVSRGAGARPGSDGAPVSMDNPFASGPNWNMSKQGQLLREQPSVAARLQQQAAAMSKN